MPKLRKRKLKLKQKVASQKSTFDKNLSTLRRKSMRLQLASKFSLTRNAQNTSSTGSCDEEIDCLPQADDNVLNVSDSRDLPIICKVDPVPKFEPN